MNNFTPQPLKFVPCKTFHSCLENSGPWRQGHHSSCGCCSEPRVHTEVGRRLSQVGACRAGLECAVSLLRGTHFSRLIAAWEQGLGAALNLRTRLNLAGDREGQDRHKPLSPGRRGKVLTPPPPPNIGPSDSTAGSAFVLQSVDPSSTSSILYGTLSTI